MSLRDHTGHAAQRQGAEAQALPRGRQDLQEHHGSGVSATSRQAGARARAGKGGAGQSRAGQSRAGQGRAQPGWLREGAAPKLRHGSAPAAFRTASAQLQVSAAPGQAYGGRGAVGDPAG